MVILIQVGVHFVYISPWTIDENVPANFVTTTTTQAPTTVPKMTMIITRSTPDVEQNNEDEQEDEKEEDPDKEPSTSRAVILKITTTCIFCSVMIAIFL